MLVVVLIVVVVATAFSDADGIGWNIPRKN